MKRIIILSLILTLIIGVNLGFAVSPENHKDYRILKNGEISIEIENILYFSKEVISNKIMRDNIVNTLYLSVENKDKDKNEEFLRAKKNINSGILGDKNLLTANEFSSVTHNELVYALSEYMSLKGIEVETREDRFDSNTVHYHNFANNLFTAKVIDENFFEQEPDMYLFNQSIERIDKLSEQKEKIEKTIMEVVSKKNATLNSNEQISFKLKHLNTGAEVSHDGDSTFHPASAVKSLYLYTFLKEVEAGERSLSDKRVFTYEDKFNQAGGRIGGSGVLQKSAVNRNFTWSDLMEYVIIRSDNVAVNMTMRELGTDKIMERVNLSELKNTDITGPIWSTPGRGTYSSAEDLSEVLYLIDNNLRPDLREYALDLLNRCQSKHRIRKKITNIDWVGNKTGTLGQRVADTAIIRYGGDQTVYLGIYVRTTDESYINIGKANNVIADLARDVMVELNKIDKEL